MLKPVFAGCEVLYCICNATRELIYAHARFKRGYRETDDPDVTNSCCVKQYRIRQVTM
jgi:hypothetical protein